MLNDGDGVMLVLMVVFGTLFIWHMVTRREDK
jgi:hypothetical protein